MKKLLRSLYILFPGKLLMFRVIRKLLPVPESIWKHLYFEGKFEFEFRGHTVSLFNYNSSFETSIFWTNTFMDEKISLDVWYELSKESRTIVDVGANAGVYSVVACLANSNASIIAFEPIARIFNRLNENINVNGLQIITEELALSNSNGETIIYDLPVDHHYHASLNKSEVIHHANITEQVIRAQRFDDYSVTHKLVDIDLVKIDVEGFELEVLEGMIETVAKHKPSILIELKDSNRAAKVEQLFAGSDYKFFNVDESQGIFETVTLGASSKWNYVLLAPKHHHVSNVIERIVA